MRRAALALGVLLGFFALYLRTLPPSLAAYRDTGEFALSAFSLGVSHPPSYPVYVLLGHAAGLPGLGNRAYALALLSALAGASCLAVLFAAAAELFEAWPALCGALLLGLNVTFWVVCGVQEMYSLTLLFAAGLLALALALRRRFDARVWLALWLCYGLFLGNRTDLLLWLPGILVLAWPLGCDKAGLRRLNLQAAAFGLIGLSVYLYLPLRSMRAPWLDWNHPATLYNLVGSLTRRGYGSTLDLLSKSYAPGSMFLPNLEVYWAHLRLDFGWLGLVLVPIGLWRSWRTDKRRFWAWALLYTAGGPVFLYMANMPPNPHAMAIVEPHYLLSDLVLCLWAAEGAAALVSILGREPACPSRVTAAFGAALAAAVAVQAFVLDHYRLADRRWDLVPHDSAANVLRSVPPGGVLVAKKDVQLFSLWYAQRVEGRRPDVKVVAQGLSHSPWYQASWRREGSPLALGPLRDASDWSSFAAANGPKVFASMDAEVPPGVPMGAPWGLVTPISANAPVSELPWEFMVRRGDYLYERRPDFFTSDLVNDHATARQRLGSRLMDDGKHDEAARRNLLSAWAMKRVFPEPGMFLAYLRMRAGDMKGSRAAYEYTDELNEKLLAMTREYHSLPEVTRAIGTSTAETLMNLGVVYEKLSMPEQAEQAYTRALVADPGAAKAHYNMAVLYWGKDWRRVVSELEAALQIDPHYEEAAKYLAVARTKV